MAKKVALGKGLASLLQDVPQEVARKSFDDLEVKSPSKSEDNSPYLIDASEIKANPHQPRKIFNEKELAELAGSIKENGIIQPLIVSKTDNGFELVAGERRLRAAKMVGLEKLPVVIKRVTEKEKAVMAIIENVQRSDLNCIEEGLAYFRLMDEFNLTQEEVAKKLGKERSTVANFLRVLKLPKQVIELIQKDLVSFGHAKILASVKERELAIRLANEVAVESLTIRELEKRIKASNRKVKPNKESEFSADYDSLQDKLEKRTGFHLKIKGKNNGSGEVTFKFSNEAEFNDIYEFLIKR